MGNPDFKGALVFTGGGTGGHYFPAIALAEGAHARWPERPVAFVGAARGIEARKLPDSPWPHLLLDVEGVVGRSPLNLGRALWKLFRARRALMRLWRRERPALVVATGGYGAAPALLAAQALGIPTFIHESNAEPGALVKQTARKARQVWLGLAAAAAKLPGVPVKVVGTPVRAAFRRVFPLMDSLRPPFRLLVSGGSGGAKALNEALMAMAPELLDRFPDWEILHQTGAKEFERLAGYPRHLRHRLAAFLECMDQEFEQASLVLGRSGASTCAELKACGRPAILVPFPQSAGDHQRWNARALVEEGRAQMVEQGPELVQQLEFSLSALMADPSARAAMARPEPNRALEDCLSDLEDLLLG